VKSWRKKTGSKVVSKPMPAWFWPVFAVGYVLAMLGAIFLFVRFGSGPVTLEGSWKIIVPLLFITLFAAAVMLFFVQMHSGVRRAVEQLGLSRYPRRMSFQPRFFGMKRWYVGGVPVSVKIVRMRDSGGGWVEELSGIFVRFWFPASLRAGFHVSNRIDKPGSITIAGRHLDQSVKAVWHDLQIPVSDEGYSAFHVHDSGDALTLMGDKNVREATAKLAEALLPFEGRVLMDDWGIEFKVPEEAQLEPELVSLAVDLHALLLQHGWRTREVSFWRPLNVFLLLLLILTVVVFGFLIYSRI